MTEPDEPLKDVLRDLIPDYAGPADPLPRVMARVRRRRARQRTLLAVSSAAAAGVVALGVPALVVAGPGGGQAAAPGGETGPAPAVSGSPAGPPPEATVHPVAAGSVGVAEWSIGSVHLEAGARHCLVSDDDLFRRDTVCFTPWQAGGPVMWDAQQFPGPAVTRVVGVAPAGTVQVRLRLADGSTVPAEAVRTPTDGSARYFGLVLDGRQDVRDVTALAAGGAPLGPPVGAPGSPPCVPGPVVDCEPG